MRGRNVPRTIASMTRQLVAAGVLTLAACRSSAAPVVPPTASAEAPPVQPQPAEEPEPEPEHEPESEPEPEPEPELELEPEPGTALSPMEGEAYGLREECESCPVEGWCVYRVGKTQNLGCGSIDPKGRYAAVRRSPRGGVAYDFLGPNGRKRARWVVCREVYAGCGATFHFLTASGRYAVYNVGETGAGGSNGVVDLETGKRTPLEARDKLTPVLSPNEKRFAYQDLYDWAGGRVAGGVYCFNLERRKEARIPLSESLEGKVRRSDHFSIAWTDDDHFTIRQYRKKGGRYTLIWEETLRCNA